MKQMLNRGFSLVEVMLIFLICSLILAASVPFITRKSRAIPSKISHGMYRCYSNGTNFTEEYYNSYSMVSSNNVAECKFKIPASATAKVSKTRHSPTQNPASFLTFYSQRIFAVFDFIEDSLVSA